MKKLLLFDFDGTIADTIDVVYAIYLNIATKHQFAIISKEDMLTYRKLPLKERLSKQGISLYQIPKIMKSSQHLQFEFMAQAKPFEGIKEALEQLSKTYRLMIVSSNSKTFIEQFLDIHHLHYFEHVFGNAKLFGKAKMIKKVIKRYRLSSEDVLYIGDETRDIDACQSMNLDMLSVSYGYDDYTLLKNHGAKRIIRFPHELKDAVEQF